MTVLPVLPWVWISASEFSSGHRFSGVVALFVMTLCACVGWIFYSGIVRRMEFEFLSHAYISKLLVDDAFRESQSARARAAADVTHVANRKRNAEAREMYKSRDWPTKAAAARALAAEFKVVPKTAERWILSWDKE
ncbi:MAG: hypothetical protein J0H50_14615 [Xanthomonadales bacterium]|nr:hypothetical protein [Xanthomonadales bacterium]